MKVVAGRIALHFDKGKTEVTKRISLPEDVFAERPSVVVSESSSAGTWVIVKAQEFKDDGFTIAALRYTGSKSVVCDAVVAWIAVGRPRS